MSHFKDLEHTSQRSL